LSLRFRKVIKGKWRTATEPLLYPSKVAEQACGAAASQWPLHQLQQHRKHIHQFITTSSNFRKEKLVAAKNFTVDNKDPESREQPPDFLLEAYE
jgi:hypothetical protein